MRVWGHSQVDGPGVSGSKHQRGGSALGTFHSRKGASGLEGNEQQEKLQEWWPGAAEEGGGEEDAVRMGVLC